MKQRTEHAYTWRWVQAQHKKSLAQRQKEEAEMLAKYEISAVFLFLFLCCFLPGILLAIVAGVGFTGFGALWVYFHYFDIDNILEQYEEPYTPEEWQPKQQKSEVGRPEVDKDKGITYHEPLTNTFYFDQWGKEVNNN